MPRITRSEIPASDIESLFSSDDDEVSFERVHAFLIERGQEFPSQSRELMSHLSLLVTGEDADHASVVSTAFPTEAHAARGWIGRFGRYLTSGTYSTTYPSGNILIRDRRTGVMLEEKIPNYVWMSLRMLYQTRAGETAVRFRRMQRLLERMTENNGRMADDPRSVKNIAPFVKFFNINVDEIAEPLSSFKTFNEFFYRKLVVGARPVSEGDNDRVCVSAADCRLTVFQEG
jgi:phosphatidylserine decarboxylase